MGRLSGIQRLAVTLPVLGGLASGVSQGADGLDGSSAAGDHEQQHIDAPAGADKGLRSPVLVYRGDRLPDSEVFVLLVPPELALIEVDGIPAPAVGREYHLLPGSHKLQVRFFRWAEVPSRPQRFEGDRVLIEDRLHLPQRFEGDHAVLEVRLQLPAAGRGILDFRVDEPERHVQLFMEALGPKQLDGRWQGMLECEACSKCPGPSETPVSIDVRDSDFVMAPDAGSRGQGRVGPGGTMMIRKKDQETFSFFGKLKEGGFRLRGHRGSAPCSIVLERPR